MPKSSWYYVPPIRQPIGHDAVQIERNGRQWSGSWRVKGDRLCIESAYGSRVVRIAPEQAENDRANALLAGLVLAEIVEERTAL